MARKARAEVEGGLYHVITRGNNRRQIFNSPADYEKFLAQLGVQKVKLPFFLYAYCLMSNHVHLLLERQAEGACGRRRGLAVPGVGEVLLCKAGLKNAWIISQEERDDPRKDTK